MGTVETILGRAALAAWLAMSVGQSAEHKTRGGVIQTILVHDLASVQPDVLRKAEQEVTRIFSQANVRIAWLHCPAGAGATPEPRPCPPYPAGTIILRIVPNPADFVKGSPLGYALLPGDLGKYATVSFRRVQLSVAHQATSTAGLHHVLGHAAAHEVGHILLGANSHSSTGLMRPNWDAVALDDASKGRLVFSRDEAKRLREAVARRAADDR